jgi:hypothetical protein
VGGYKYMNRNITHSDAPVNQHALRQVTDDNVTTVLIRMNNDAEIVIRREYDKSAKSLREGCIETPYTRSEYESIYGELAL